MLTLCMLFSLLLYSKSYKAKAMAYTFYIEENEALDKLTHQMS